MFKVFASFFADRGLQWEKLVGVCMDGDPTITRIKQKSPNAVGTHCKIHREALAARTLTVAVKDKRAIEIRVVNFVKASASNTRLFKHLSKKWILLTKLYCFIRLSKDSMFACVYAMREEARRFLESQGKQDLLLSFTSEEFQLTLAYLVDIFSSFNHLNLLLQDSNTNHMNDYNAICAYIAKLGLWQCRVQREIQPHFQALTQLCRKKV